MIKETIDRHSPLGIFNLAEDFHRVANHLLLGALRLRFQHLLVLSNNVHSIELALKAFLRATGSSNNDLKVKYGHNLDRMFGDAVHNGLSLGVSQEKTRFIVNWLNDLAKDQVFRYFETGALNLPDLEEVDARNALLLHAVKPKCLP